MKKLLLVLPLVLLLVGCKDPYGAVEKASLDTENGVTAGMQTVQGLASSNLITPVEEANVLGYLKFVNDAAGALGACGKTAHDAGGVQGSFTTCAQTFQTTLNNPQQLALVHVTNQSALTQINTITQGLVAGGSTLISALGGK